ncbi:FecR family protein [Pedobacter glucosidilyticus]|uniref:FecR family protein n=1 Tax=Pedobacter glucosidilyticus TaxID=1122941 RepID=UPI00040C7080|nr:FecR domain-containing protein [Pedobacter glucosidilyticus]
MKKLNATQLLEKYRLGTISDEEKAILEAWYNSYVKSEAMINLSEKEIEQDLLKISEKVPFADTKIKQLNRNRFIIKVSAAAALIFLSLFTFLYFNRTSEKSKTIVEIQKEIIPAQNKAVLVLANNKRIVLDDSSIGELVNQSDISISKTADGKLKYKVLKSNTEEAAEVQYNTISTPRGAQYQVELADGSLIWLNASSSISFPTRFDGDDRVVKITGEVYFEVAKDKSKPFRVSTGNQLVEVLGTHFNIDAHSKIAIKTTLLEGSIRVSSGGSKRNAKILVPGEQSLYDHNNLTIQISKVDLEKAVAWKNGYFLFVDDDLTTIMEEISRWYDVDIIYIGNKKISQKFSGTISRSKSLAQVLRVLEVSGNVNFKVEGRRIKVMF